MCIRDMLSSAQRVLLCYKCCVGIRGGIKLEFVPKYIFHSKNLRKINLKFVGFNSTPALMLCMFFKSFAPFQRLSFFF